MQIFSEAISGKESEVQRRLYTLFQRSVKAGEFRALKLLTRFDLVGSKGQPRRVYDYAFTDETAAQVGTWLDHQARTRKPRGLKLEDLQGITDAELSALIQQQNKTGSKRSPRKPKKGDRTTPKDAQAKAPGQVEGKGSTESPLQTE